MAQPVVEPMGEEFLVWRCLHQGPLNPGNIGNPAPHPEIDWPAARVRSIPALRKIVRTYGSCAILARDGDDVVGTLRFYPKALASFSDGGAGLCLLQPFPAGFPADMAARDLVPLEDLPDKTLFVHCLFLAAPTDDPARYRRRGLASRMARELVRWAREKGWTAVEANAYEDIPMLYDIAGVAGKTFWTKLGFRVVHADVEPAMKGDLLESIRRSAAEAGIPAERAANRYRMRLDLDRDR